MYETAWGGLAASSPLGHDNVGFGKSPCGGGWGDVWDRLGTGRTRRDVDIKRVYHGAWVGMGRTRGLGMMMPGDDFPDDGAVQARQGRPR